MQQPSFQSLIPPQPEILIQLTKQCQQAEPDFDTIVLLIKSDVALYAAVLKLINSPYFGLRAKITSVQHAIGLLGIRRIFNLARLILMRNTLDKTGRMERFWDTAQDVSKLSILLAKRFELKLSTDDLHTLGMLHDCGLPLMVQAFDDYRDFLRDTCAYSSAKLEQCEEERFGLSHYKVGARMAERWLLPPHIIESIRLQPLLVEVLSDRILAEETSRHLLAVLSLAQDISAEYRYYWRIQPNDLATGVAAALAFLGVPEHEYLGYREDLIENLP